MTPVGLLEYASATLGTLCEDVVFLGGAVVGLLRTDEGGPPPRFTKDIDVAIKVSDSLLEAHALDHRLRSIGFINDMGGPVCRYLHGSVVLDVIPVVASPGGDENDFYRWAIKTAEIATLPSGRHIRVISAASFLATKLAAFRSPAREHHDDTFLSRDFGDIVSVIDGRSSIVQEVRQSPLFLRGFLLTQFELIVRSPYIEEAILQHVERGREYLVVDRMREFLL